MLDPRGEFLSDLLSGVILEAAQDVKSPEVLPKEMLMKNHLGGCWSQSSLRKENFSVTLLKEA